MPHLAIVDGIVGMEGDGPLNGTAKHVGALIMGVSAALLQQHLLWEGGVGLLVSLLLFSRGFPYSSRRNRRRTDPKDEL